MTHLESDDIEVGQHVTVLDWKPREIPNFGGPLFGAATATTTFNDRSGVGSIFIVAAIDRPFVVLRRTGFDAKLFTSSPTWTVDTRQCRLKHLSPEFVANALHGDAS